MDSTTPDKLLVKCQDMDDERVYPQCVHGPAVLFYRKHKTPQEGFFACSAYRDRNLCDFYKPVNSSSQQNDNINCAELYAKNVLKIRNEWLQILLKDGRHFCFTCYTIIKYNTLRNHRNHEICYDIFRNPQYDVALNLIPAAIDKGQAQYLFDDSTVEFFVNTIKSLGFTHVICIGAPRIHWRLRLMREVNKPRSFLLDIDWRYLYYFKDEEFAWYNMCNNYFFNIEHKMQFFKFLRGSQKDSYLLFVDPPFGCRTELIANSLRQIALLQSKVNESVYRPMAIFWIFPYFSEKYIRDEMPSMEMTDYKVNYINHNIFSNNGHANNRRLGSPVRLFTNLSQNLIRLPSLEYRFCDICQRYSALENMHCSICNICPSRNGARYRHCSYCDTCVKPTYSHCFMCRRCTRMENHVCVEFQLKQVCWICKRRGHIERNCLFMPPTFTSSPVSSLCDGEEVFCYLCKISGQHTEKKCPKRGIFLNHLVNEL